jgi:hypothetical protein
MSTVFAWQRHHTVGRPGKSTSLSTRVHSIDTGNLKPNISCSLERVDVFAIWHLGHVELDRARMSDTLIRYEADSAAGGDGGGSGPGAHLEATDIGAADIRDAMIILVVLRHADGRPLFRLGLAIDNELGKSI